MELQKSKPGSWNLLWGTSPHHVLNTRDFVQHLKGIRLQQDECIMSYDVKAPFTSVPIQPTVNIIKKQAVQRQGHKDLK